MVRKIQPLFFIISFFSFYMQPPQKNNSSDDFQTPENALLPLFNAYQDFGLITAHHLEYKFATPKSNITILDPACGKGNIVNYCNKIGYNSIGSDIKNGTNFLDFTEKDVQNVDYIVTNPPYTKKLQFLQKAIELEKPFCFLLPITYEDNRKTMALLEPYLDDITVIVPNIRYNFETPSGKKDKDSNSWFKTVWLCCGFNSSVKNFNAPKRIYYNHT
jgi:SAM-dependent methyltransferase